MCPSVTGSSKRSTRRHAVSTTKAASVSRHRHGGFIRRLPNQLVEGFAATLELTLVADLVLHVVDGSVPEEPPASSRSRAVDAVLHEIGADELPLELVVNKIDAVDALVRRRLANRYPDALQVSARDGRGARRAAGTHRRRFAERFEPVRLLLPYDEGGKLNELYALGAPIEEREDTTDGVLVLARLPRARSAFARTSSPTRAKRATVGA